MTFLELVAALVTLLAVYLTARQVIWCWPTALVSVTLYAVVFWGARLYADMGLQAVYFALSVYGWWAWLHGGEDQGELEVAVASWPLRALLLAIGLGLALVMGTTLERFTNASLPFMDSTLTSFSLVGQFLMTRKLIDNWVVWIAVDVAYVGMFVYKQLYLTAGLYALFLVLATMGLVGWYRSMLVADHDPVEEAEAA